MNMRRYFLTLFAGLVLSLIALPVHGQATKITRRCPAVSPATATAVVEVQKDGDINIVPCPGRSVVGVITANRADDIQSYANLAAMVTAIGSTSRLATVSANTTCSTAITVPATLQLEFTNGARVTESGTCTITFQGIGLLNPESTQAAFVGFESGDITWSGSVWPPRISSSLWSDSTWDARANRACDAFTNKDVTIVVHPGGSLTTQVEVNAKQRLYLTAGDYTNAWAGADVAQIVMNSDTEIFGDGMGRTRIQESPASGNVRLIYSKEANTHPFDGTNDNIKVHDLTLYGNTVQRSNSERSAILLGNGKQHHIYRVEGYYLHGFFAYVGLFGTSGNTADGWSITDCVSRGTMSQAIGAITGRNGIIARNQFLDIQPVHFFVTDGVTNGTTTVTSATGGFNAAMAAANIRITTPGQTTHATTVVSATNNALVLTDAVPFSVTGASVEMVGAFAAAIDLEPSSDGGWLENIQIVDNVFDSTHAQQFHHAILVQATDVVAAKNIRVAGNVITGQEVMDRIFYSTDVNTSTERITIPEHQLETGQNIQFATTGTLPTGLNAAGQIYSVIRIDNDTIKLAHSYGYALAGTAIDLTGAGAGRSNILGYSYLTTGIILDGAHNSQVAGNKVQRATQYGMSFYNSSELDVYDNKLLHVGGGGVQAMIVQAVMDSRFSRNIIRDSALGSGSTSRDVLESEITTSQANTSGVNVTITGSGNRARRWWQGKTVTINSVDYTVETWRDVFSIILTSTAGTQTGVTLATKGFSNNSYRDNDWGTLTPSLTGTSVVYSNYADFRKKGTVTVDPASINATTVATQTFTLTGAATGDTVVLNPPTAGLTAGLLVLQVRVSAANTVAVTFHNTTGSAIDEASASWVYQLSR